MRVKRKKENIFDWVLCLTWYKSVQNTAVFYEMLRIRSSFDHRFLQSEKSILLSEEPFFCPVGKISLAPALSTTPWQPGHIRDIPKRDLVKSM